MRMAKRREKMFKKYSQGTLMRLLANEKGGREKAELKLYSKFLIWTLR